jgi:hypothetical protein
MGHLRPAHGRSACRPLYCDQSKKCCTSETSDASEANPPAHDRPCAVGQVTGADTKIRLEQRTVDSAERNARGAMHTQMNSRNAQNRSVLLRWSQYEFMRIQIHAYTDSCVYRFIRIQIHAYTDSCVYRFMRIRIHAYTNSCVYEFMRIALIRLHSHPWSQSIPYI